MNQDRIRHRGEVVGELIHEIEGLENKKQVNPY